MQGDSKSDNRKGAAAVRCGSSRWSTVFAVGGASLLILAVNMAGCRRVVEALAVSVAAEAAVAGAAAAHQASLDQTAANEFRHGKVPPPGHIWISTHPDDLRVKWVPGRRHDTHPLVAAQRPNHWNAAPGWRFTEDPTDGLAVERVDR